MQNSKLQALAEQYGISEDEVVEGLLGMQGIIADNPKLARLFEIANSPDPDDNMKSELEMALGGYNDKLNSQTEQYNKSLGDFDGIVLALAQKLYPNATPESIIENLSKAVAPEGVESFGNVERFMQALGMFENNEETVQDAQDEANSLIEQANESTGEQLQGEQVNNEVIEDNGMQNLDEIEIMQTKVKTDDDIKNLSGKDLIKAMAQKAAKGY